MTIDPKTGQGILRPERIPKLGVPVEYCPGPGGLKNLFAMAYHPRTRAFYIPLKLSCARSVFDAYTTSGRHGPAVATASPSETSPAIQPARMKSANSWRWTAELERHCGGSAIACPTTRRRSPRRAISCFIGDISGRFSAMDIETGKVMWEVKTTTAADGFPITYAVGGKQYLAVPSGPGWFLGWQQVRDFFPEVPRPAASGSAIQVYALPEN